MINQKPLVNFLIVGAQKSGTTTLHAYLKEHPEIIMSARKEVHFFNKDEFFETIEPDYSYYHSFFDEELINTQIIGLNKKLLGEATPAYLYCRDAAKRIWQYNPSMKIIIILRNPIDRAFSHWNMEVSRGAESLSFSDALKYEPERCKQALPAQHYVYSYLDRGFYSAQIREYWRFFSKQQVLVIKYDELVKAREKVLQEVFGFLGVDQKKAQILSQERKKLNAIAYEEHMSSAQRRDLSLYYKYEIKQLEAMLGWQCGKWLTG
jgi:hypothetical protein